MRKPPESDSLKIGIIPDSHFDEHDPTAISCVLKVFREARPDIIVHLGDLVDNKPISRFSVGKPKDQVGRLKDQWMLAANFVSELKQIASRVYLLEGNHETRLTKFLEMHPSLEGLIDLPGLLGIDPGKFILSDSKGLVLRFEQQANKIVPVVRDPSQHQAVLFHGLSCIHGWKYNMHHAKTTGEMIPWPGPVVAGDTHDEQTYSSNRWGQDKPTVYNFGVLSREMDYTKGRPNRWVQGFGIVHLAKSLPGVYRVEPYRIYRGNVIGPDGKVL